VALGMEVGLSPGDFVLDGDPAPLSKKGAGPLPNFQPISIVAKRQDASRCHLVWRWASAEGTLCSMGIGDPAPLPKNGAEPPDFRPMSIAAKRLDGSR